MLRTFARMAVAVVIAASLVLPFLGNTAAADDNALADESIRAVWSSVDAAWNARDVESISRLFADDATFIIVSGQTSLQGLAQIHGHFAGQFVRQSPELRHETQVRRIQYLDQRLAAVDSEVRVLRVAPDDGAEPGILRTFAVFAVMTQDSEVWKLRSLRIYPLSAE